MYLILTVPLTHIVNAIDRRLREGRTPVEEPPLDPVGIPTSDTDPLVPTDRH